jgi:hypothetical protein
MFLFRIRLKLGLAASFPDRYVPVSEWSTRHDIQGAVLCRMALTTPTALHELGALIFSNDALHLEQQVVFRTLAQRPVQEDQLDIRPPPLVQKQDLVRVIAGQSVGRMNIDPVDSSDGG